MNKKRALVFIARLILKLGLFCKFLNFVNNWSLKKNIDNRLAFPFIKRRKHILSQILFYHHVNDDNDPFFGGIPSKVFGRQMEMLNKYFNILSLEELAERMASNDVHPNSVAITFDDGYKDNYKNAFPYLKKFGLPATIFLPTGVLESEKPLWHDMVFDAFRKTKVDSLDIGGKEYGLGSISEKLFAMKTFLKDIRMFTPERRNDHVQQLNERLGTHCNLSVRDEMLSWQEIKEMSNHKISFGAHTVNHPIMTRMPLTGAVDEIINSQKTIEEKLGLPVRLFAYPNGSQNDFNEPIKQAVKDAGFLCAVTTVWGCNDNDADFFELRRMSIEEQDISTFMLKLGWYKF